MTETSANTQQLVGKVPVHLEHPELHHYTQWSGLHGILSTGCLYGTHYKHLNDRTEIVHLRDYLVRAAAERLKVWLIEKARGSQRLRIDVTRAGGAARLASSETRQAVDNMYKAAFEGVGSPPHALPYITSFCSHSKDQKYEQRHGLLSQWRSYGREAGFAIVFDAAELGTLLQAEYDGENYAYLGFWDVAYNDGYDDFQRKFEPLIEKVAEFMRGYANGRTELPSDFLATFLVGTSRFKHRGFFEEREVRIVSFPTSPSSASQNPDPQGRLAKMAFLRAGGIPTIRLFESRDGKRLPITRIIVGPSRNQKEHVENVRGLVRNAIQVVASETPYIERQAPEVSSEAPSS